MAGEPVSAKDRIDQRSEKLEEYLVKKGLPQPETRSIDQYLSMTRSELSRYAPEDLGEIAYEIDAYAYYLQDLINRHESKKFFCQCQIEALVGGVLSNYNIYGQKEKWLAAIHDNDHARAFWENQNTHELVIQRLSYLSKRLEKISNTLENLQMTKRRFNAKT
jgi:hypothetical protein